jgi:hypothetical protein
MRAEILRLGFQRGIEQLLELFLIGHVKSSYPEYPDFRYLNRVSNAYAIT